MKTKTMAAAEGERVDINEFPNFSRTGSIRGMKKKYYGKNALLVKCCGYIYNVSSEPHIYDLAH